MAISNNINELDILLQVSRPLDCHTDIDITGRICLQLAIVVMWRLWRPQSLRAGASPWARRCQASWAQWVTSAAARATVTMCTLWRGARAA